MIWIDSASNGAELTIRIKKFEIVWKSQKKSKKVLALT
jgi:hypothetical protein